MTVDLTERTLKELAAFHATGYHFVQSYNKKSLSGAKGFLEEFPFLNYTGWLPSLNADAKAKNDGMIIGQISIIATTLKECCSDVQDRYMCCSSTQEDSLP
jgi:hypothetical protein